MKTYLQWPQIKDSKLLSPEREQEVEKLINERYEPLFDKEGRQLEGLLTYWLMKGGKKTTYIYEEWNKTLNRDYSDREIMQEILTDDEIRFINKECFPAQERLRQAALFKKAQKIPILEWDNGFFWGDEYCRNLGELEEKLEWTETEKPAYVWAASPDYIVPNYDSKDVYGNHIDDIAWEDFSWDELSGVKELESALDKFHKINKNLVSYSIDYTKAIVL